MVPKPHTSSALSGKAQAISSPPDASTEHSCVQIPSRIPLSFCKRKLVTVFQKLLEPLSRCSFLLWLQPFVFWELLDSSWSAPSNDAQVEATMVNVFLSRDWLIPHVTLEGRGRRFTMETECFFLFYILGANRIP